jgi:hypothetical protein
MMPPLEFAQHADRSEALTGGLPALNDELDIETLTDVERQTLQNVLSKTALFQTKLSYDFLGVAGR